MTSQIPTRYYVQISRRAFGPFSSEAIKEMVAQGRIEGTTLLSLDKKTWKEASAIPEIFSSKINFDANEPPRQIETDSFIKSAPQDPAPDENVARKWLVSVDGRECSGSFTTRELFDLFRANKISSDALVWRQGDAVSHTLAKNQEIQQEFASFQAAPDPFVKESRPKEKEAARSSTVAFQEINSTPRRSTERLASKIKARFLSVWICLGVTTATTIFATILQYRGIQTISLTEFTLGSLVSLLAGLSFVGAVVFGAAFLHAFWSAIPPKYARANPNEAVAFVFVPGFGIYWIFQALYGGAVDANEALERFKSEENDEKNVLFVSPGWALATSLFFDLGGPFNPVSGFFFLLSLGVTTVQMKNVALKLDSLNGSCSQTNRR